MGEIEVVRKYVNKITEMNKEFNEYVEKHPEMYIKLYSGRVIEGKISEYARENQEVISTFSVEVIERALKAAQIVVEMMTGETGYEEVKEIMERHVKVLEEMLDEVVELQGRCEIIE